MASRNTPVSLREVLSAPGVPRTLGSSIIGRLPYGVVGLLLILRVRDLGGDYAQGGLLVAAFSLGAALSAPVIGRLVDARGQTRVLIWTAVGCSVPLVAIGLAPAQTPMAVLAMLAAATGLLNPPLGGCLRALWPTLVPQEDRRHAAYTLEATALESVFILGPLVFVGGLAAVAGPGPALIAAAAALLGGTIAFARSEPARAWRPSRRSDGDALGALRSRGLIVLCLAATAMGASFGAIEVATTAFAEEHARRTLVGPLLACSGLGSLAGGIFTARRGAPANPARRLAYLLALLAVADAALALAPGPPALAALLAVAGFCIAPAFATLHGLVSGVARTGTVTESYTWLATGVTAGAGLGAASAGGLMEMTHPAAGFAAAAIVVAAGAATVSLHRTTLVAARGV